MAAGSTTSRVWLNLTGLCERDPAADMKHVNKETRQEGKVFTRLGWKIETVSVSHRQPSPQHYLLPFADVERQRSWKRRGGVFLLWSHHRACLLVIRPVDKYTDQYFSKKKRDMKDVDAVGVGCVNNTWTARQVEVSQKLLSACKSESTNKQTNKQTNNRQKCVARLEKRIDWSVLTWQIKRYWTAS